MEIGPIYVDGIARFNLSEVAVVCAGRWRRGIRRTEQKFTRLKALQRSAAGKLKAFGEHINSLKKQNKTE